MKKANFLVLANKSRERERERERERTQRQKEQRERKRENLKMSDTQTDVTETREKELKKNFFGPTFWSKNASKKPTPQTECDLLGKFFSHTCDALLIKESIYKRRNKKEKMSASCARCGYTIYLREASELISCQSCNLTHATETLFNDD